ncbi:MAG: hypothetical protein A4E32_01218 [Methanomassiliicoccales archaeon PtaU1.Bin124]|nr:MAG: hypothetical protein A4E32_01218 [Methanomassiliicoccales archaeon PtaU1.Bin124]
MLKLDVRKDWDVAAILVTTPLLILAIFLLPDTPLRVVLGLPFLLFFPGYVTVLALFPARKDLEPIERIALSFGLSIAISPLIGFGLNYTPFGIRLVPILACLSIFNVAIALVGLWRRYQVDEPFLPFDVKKVMNDALGSYRAEKGVDRALTIILVIAILLSVVALVYVIAVPRQGESYTELYLLGPDGKAENYPNNLTVGQNGTVIIGLANHEHKTVTYFIEIWLVNATYIDNQTQVNKMYYYDTLNVTLDHVDANLEGNWTSQWEKRYTFSFNVTGQYKLWFLLYEDAEPSEPANLQKMVDYSGTVASERISEAVLNHVQSVNLNMRIYS